MSTVRSATIGPSILTANFLELGAEIERAELAGVDFIHLDVMDGRFVPNLSFGPMVVAAIRRATSLPVDVHLMIEEPERYVADFVQAGADRVTVHVESSRHLHRTLSLIEELGAMPGVSLVPSTPLSAVTEVLPICGQLLVMLVNPGFGGQAMIPEMLNKVERARGLIDATNPDCLLEVDGGVKADNIGSMVRAGANAIVVGSAIYNERQRVEESVALLRRAIDQS
jgi:ribulose-phosphate 3-epimerase